MASEIPNIFDLAAFKARRLGLIVTRDTVADWVKKLSSDTTLFRYRTSSGFENVPMIANGKDVVFQWRPDRNLIIDVLPPHPKGTITPGCLSYLMSIVGAITQDDVKELIRLVESPKAERRVIDSGAIEAIVEWDKLGGKTDVLYDPATRRIMRASPHVFRYATDHAIKRAKQRYHLPLTSDIARDMVEMMKSGQYVLNKPGAFQDKDTIRATLHYDHEDFTIVYDPREEKIVTLTPPGDFDLNRKLRGE